MRTILINNKSQTVYDITDWLKWERVNNEDLRDVVAHACEFITDGRSFNMDVAVYDEAGFRMARLYGDMSYPVEIREDTLGPIWHLMKLPEMAVEAIEGLYPVISRGTWAQLVKKGFTVRPLESVTVRRANIEPALDRLKYLDAEEYIQRMPGDYNDMAFVVHADNCVTITKVNIAS